MTLMQVKALTHDATTQQAVVVLEEPARRLGLAFHIPLDEANRLARALGLTPCQCVPAFDLLEGLIGHFGARVTRIVLDAGGLGISSTIHVSTDEADTTFPSHPADALALATRAGVPVYATDEALRHACPLDQPHRHEINVPDISRWLERVRPEDFEG